MGLDTASDRVSWERADALAAVIVTKDEDFARRRAVALAGLAVVWARLGNARRRDILRWFSLLFPQIVAALRQGETLIEVR